MSINLNTDIAEKIQRRRYYIVDFSSVKSEGLDGMEKLTADDNITVFYVRGESSVDFSLLSKFYSCGARVTMKEIGRKDLLPFVISMYIGSIVNENPDIHLVCRNGGNYVESAGLVAPAEIKVQQSISGVKTAAKVQQVKASAPVSENPFDRVLEIMSGYNLPHGCEIELKDYIGRIMKEHKPVDFRIVGSILNFYETEPYLQKELISDIKLYMEKGGSVHEY